MKLLLSDLNSMSDIILCAQNRATRPDVFNVEIIASGRPRTPDELNEAAMLLVLPSLVQTHYFRKINGRLINAVTILAA